MAELDSVYISYNNSQINLYRNGSDIQSNILPNFSSLADINRIASNDSSINNHTISNL